ncbi:COX15/CtaA family protein [Legionella jordanis]|uniref:Cytochrome c oxidase assembly protein n=1 Tax=Legionella jordanis TaxID=456 RepID=A0A0W0VE08_9GAMM|nr:COX15/CtaA family protein [Legionella jordanis]KTD18334.1 cytochrome c oxidase assembly protein [Legionella jordanis]RMX05249.1 heme A synthase [Legionella jordanis]VEH13320.1 cytochrome c oxidase assembly protein [Legionella jordanis]
MLNPVQGKFIRLVVTVAVVLALFVVMLGAYTRLTDAGLGCPDWPGCYGHMVLPKDQQKLQSAQYTFPQIPLETRKAWTEMAHRYAAGSLALLIFIIAGYAFWPRNPQDRFPWQLPLVLFILVFFQAALGMWTVTLKLLPVVVMGHLLGGILIFSCLARLRLQLSFVRPLALPQWRFWLALGVAIVFIQIALGGWVSSNYAGLACIGFPQCNGQWLPPLHFAQGFNLFSPVGENYQGGLLDNDIRMTIQYIHRLGAMITAAYVFCIAILSAFKVRKTSFRVFAILAILLVLIQFTLGVLNVIYLLPLGIAVAHNGVAALLLATMLMMLYLTQGRPANACCN